MCIRDRVEEAFEMALNNRNKANAAAEQDNSIIVMNDAVEALVSLGYSSKDAIKACLLYTSTIGAAVAAAYPPIL